MEAYKEPDMTPSDLYNMAMSDNTAGDHMHELCRLLGTPYPPRVDDFTELTGDKSCQSQQWFSGNQAPEKQPAYAT